MTDRSAYVDKMKAKVDEWTADIEKMQAKAKGAQADARIEFDKQLRRDAQAARRGPGQDEGSPEASDEAWDDMRKGFETPGTACRRRSRRAEALHLIRSRGGAGCAVAESPPEESRRPGERPDQPLAVADGLALMRPPSISIRSPGRGFGTSATRRSSRVVSDQSRASPKPVTSSARRVTTRTRTGAPPSAM